MTHCWFLLDSRWYSGFDYSCGYSNQGWLRLHPILNSNSPKISPFYLYQDWRAWCDSWNFTFVTVFSPPSAPLEFSASSGIFYLMICGIKLNFHRRWPACLFLASSSRHSLEICWHLSTESDPTFHQRFCQLSFVKAIHRPPLYLDLRFSGQSVAIVRLQRKLWGPSVDLLNSF